MPAPACPRCAYDLSGTVATWHDSCPLTGLCSECGLNFDWADVHDPDRNRVRGLFEHARGPWQAARWLELTWLLTLWPPRFWRKVRLESPVNARRAALWPLLITLVVWAAGSIVTNAATLAAYFTMPKPFRSSSDELLAILANGWMDPVAGFRGRTGTWALEWSSDLRWWIRYMIPLAVAAAAWVLLILLLPWTMRDAKVRRVHILRAAAYSLAWLPMLALVHLADAFSWVANVFTAPGSANIGGYFSDGMFAWWPYVLVALTAWLMLWWYSALRTGFRLQSARKVWCTLAVAVALSWLVALIMTGGLIHLMAVWDLV